MNIFKKITLSAVLACGLLFSSVSNLYAKSPIVLLTDFGTKDGAVSAMKGVIYSVNQNLTVADLTHEIAPFDISGASYRLYQVMKYYPKNTVFVAVVDPGVGTSRKSIVAKTEDGYYVVAPDNGIITYVVAYHGLKEVRQIDEKRNRLPSSEESYTFHGRDVYAYTAAKLASGEIGFRGVGPLLSSDLVTFSATWPTMTQDAIRGSVIALDENYGNLWTNVDADMLHELGIDYGEEIALELYSGKKLLYKSDLLFSKTFGEVREGKEVAYINSLGNFAVAINRGNFAKKYKITAGTVLYIRKVK